MENPSRWTWWCVTVTTVVSLLPRMTADLGPFMMIGASSSPSRKLLMSSKYYAKKEGRSEFMRLPDDQSTKPSTAVGREPPVKVASQ